MLSYIMEPLNIIPVPLGASQIPTQKPPRRCVAVEADARKVGVSQTIFETRNYRRRTDRKMQKWMAHNIIHKITFQNI